VHGFADSGYERPHAWLDLLELFDELGPLTADSAELERFSPHETDGAAIAPQSSSAIGTVRELMARFCRRRD
jgi:hypothetical protein